MWDDALDDAANVEHIGAIAGWLAATRIVDLGCGTGNHVRALRERGRHAVGVDFSPGMLARAAAKAPGQCVRGGLLQLPFRARSFDGALSIYSIQFFVPGELLREVRRVLVPGGQLLVEVPVPAKGSKARWAKRIATRLGLLVGLAKHHREDGLRRDLAAAGFTVTERRDFARSYALLCTNEQAPPLGSPRL